MNSLLERAEAIRARNRLLMTVPGSGHHSNDRDAHNRLCAPHCRHMVGGMSEGSPALPPLSDHVIAFWRAREFIFVGACAERVMDALDNFVARVNQKKMSDMDGTEIKILETFPELNIENDELHVWRDTWNDILHVLDVEGLGVTCAPYTPDGTTP